MLRLPSIESNMYNRPVSTVMRELSMDCSFDGCGKAAFAKGFCRGHYRQHHAGETLRPLQIQFHGYTEAKRFLRRVDRKGPRECWEWTGSRQNGWHGQWRNSSGNHELAHRAAWRLFNGQIPDGLFVLHRCDNPACVNTSHLFLGTQSDNALDMWAKGRSRPKQLLGEQHGMSKLTTDDVRRIRASSEPAKKLAKKFGVSQTTIYEIRIRKTWKHI